MNRRPKIFIAKCILWTVSLSVTAIALSSCDNRAAPPPSSEGRAEIEASVDPERSALIGFAHRTLLRRVGEDVVFVEETTSAAAGKLTACGSFSRSYNPGLGYYLAKTGEVNFVWQKPYPDNWKVFCTITQK
jgi:hypothetical protein